MPEGTFKLLDNIGEELVKVGLISADQLAVVKETQKNLGGDIGHILVRKGFLTNDQVLAFLSDKLKIPFVSLKDYNIDPEMVKLVPMSLAKKYHFMPLFKIENAMTIAMADPLDVFAIDELRSALKCAIQPMLASAEEIDDLIKDNYRLLELSEGSTDEDIEVVQYRGDVSDDVADRLQEMASGSKVIAEVNRIIRSAVLDRASDIHIEPMESAVKVRNRIDGLLEERIVLAKNMHLPIVTRIKIMGDMDIAERRVPQDGRVRIKFRGKTLDMRLSTYPTIHGEKVVIRLLTKEQVVGVESLGFDAGEQKIFENIISFPHGIFLVTGPTGSGKTTTLYAALQKLNSQDRNIVSIEDPIENEIQGVSQAQVNIKAGMTFASAMRSILRQDPDVIMVGEIRDNETADMAIRAAITGHFVLSTIHTNTALGAIARLEDLGAQPFMLASSLVGLMSQRLVRRICKHCKKETQPEEEKLIALGLPKGMKTYKGTGCKYCRMTGYSGRVGIFEIAEVTNDLRELILKNASEEEMTTIAKKNGLRELQGRGVQKVKEGITTVDEVLRVTEIDESRS
jgi:type IV pilus assembly protein PilB